MPETGEAHSAQIILPQKQLGRSTDMYIFACSYQYNVAAKGKWIALVSAPVETEEPEKELEPGLKLLGTIDYKFYSVQDVYEPVNDPSIDRCYISKGYDATTDFESTVEDVLQLYTKITGEEVDLSERHIGEAEVE